MFVTVHVASGAAISTLIPNPIVAVPVAFASHFVIDAIPHWQDVLKGEIFTRRTKIVSSIDVALAVSVVLIMLLTTSHDYLLYGIVAGTIIETDVVVYPFCEKRGWKKPWPKLISKLHGVVQNETRSLWGLLPQAAIFALSLLIVFSLNS